MDTAILVTNGSEQAVQLPREYRFKGEKVYLKRMGNAVVLIPEETPEENTWNSLLESSDMFTEDFMEDRNQPAQQERSELFE